MRKLLLTAGLAAAALTAAPAAAVTVNVDGVANASTNGSNAVALSLGAGTYSISFIQDAFTAFTRFSSVSGCDGAGGNCRQGWENSIKYVVNGITYSLGDAGANGQLGPNADGGHFQTAALSLAHASIYSSTFQLAAPGSVSFYIFDDNLSDNSGGVSLAVNAISAVPEPATWAFMILGFGAAGVTMRRRRSAANHAVA